MKNNNYNCFVNFSINRGREGYDFINVDKDFVFLKHDKMKEYQDGRKEKKVILYNTERMISVEKGGIVSKIDVILNNSDFIIHHHPFSDVVRMQAVFKTYRNLILKEKECEYFGFKGAEYEFELKRIMKEKENGSIITSLIGNSIPYFRRYYIYAMENFGLFMHHCGKAGFQSGSMDCKVPRSMCKTHIHYSKYKFVLIFENTPNYNYKRARLCYAVFSKYSIPVYMGAPNVESIFRPWIPFRYKIFINAYDFINPEDLVKYLLYLDKNETAYMEYFQWHIDGYSLKDLPMFDKTIAFGCSIFEWAKFGEKKCRKNVELERIIEGFDEKIVSF